MSFGLTEADLEYIVHAIKSFKQIEHAVIFGSRAKGNFKSGSDIDIAIYGENITFDVLAKLHSILEDESPLPYLFDIIDMTHNVDQKFKEHVDRVGVVIYKSEI